MPMHACSDGTVHNFDNYMNIRAVDMLPAIQADSVNAVFTQELGVVIGETQLEDFLSQIS
ncbi:hypothetical protein SLEP1_g36743 [Rubroshorea leprosula]|uniref:Uncharacterized protein n=1 Tax=Rubroshorea leprosula TaxID=152421 RepID=A0AAV5KSP3_9ROSI|nr:hypothetical protein SLEP1_g36743 [Rubroshorea leprosula]